MSCHDCGWTYGMEERRKDLKQGSYTILENQRIAERIFRMKLFGDTSEIKAPGQFINLLLDGFYLRRPISVCDVEENVITILYKAVGRGTEAMSAYPAGKKLDVLVGLGNGFSVERCGQHPILIGGGIGVPPMYYLAKCLKKAGKEPIVVLGFNRSEESFYIEEFQKLGIRTEVATADGSIGTHGFVTDVLDNIPEGDSLCCCGPLPMLRAVYEKSTLDGQFSFEERMGCGFGACMGCSCKTLYGNKRICKDGPVLERGEILWDAK